MAIVEEEACMARGTVLRDTRMGDGIVSIAGEQKTFSLTDHWRSEAPPAVGMKVDIQLDDQGSVKAVSQIDDGQLAKEQAQKAWATVSAHGRHGAGQLVKQVGLPTLAAIGVLFIAWVYLSTFSVRLSANQSLGVSFWDVLKMVNSGTGLEQLYMLANSGGGLYSLLMWVCLLLPLAPSFHPNRNLVWAYFAPLCFMVCMLTVVRMQIKNATQAASGAASSLGGMFGDGNSQAMVQEMVNNMVARVLDAISFGPGFYIGLLAAGYLAFVGVRSLLARRTTV